MPVAIDSFFGTVSESTLALQVYVLLTSAKLALRATAARDCQIQLRSQHKQGLNAPMLPRMFPGRSMGLYIP